MVIKQKTEILTKEEEKKREKFISKGGYVSADKKEKGDFTNVLFRIPTSLLKELDELIKLKPWMNRTQWIVEAIHDKIKSEFDAIEKDDRTGNQ